MNMNKQQLLESLDYIAIKRGMTRPIKLDEILQARMTDFLDRRLSALNGATISAKSKLVNLD